MIRPKSRNPSQPAEPIAGRPASSGEEWLGSNRSAKQKLWERLNPLHRKQLRLMAEAMALHQNHAHLPEPLRVRLSAAVVDMERLLRRIATLLEEVAGRTPPRE